MNPDHRHLVALKRLVRTVLLAATVVSLAPPAPAQQADSARAPTDVSGSVTVTNKGISTIPSFTLGKPAALLDLSIARGALAFQPQFRVGLNGRPWTFLFWGRYRLVDGQRLQVSVGAQPALSFRSTSVTTEGTAREVIVARRYLAGELAPTYALSKQLSVGGYYLYSYGVEPDVVKHTHYAALRAFLSSAGLARGYSIRVSPQAYYLRVGERDGYYLNSGLTVSRPDLPLSLSTTVNQPIQTRVPGGEDFLWNVSLTYAIR